MIKELKIFIYLIVIFLFFILLFKHYLSDDYKKHSYRTLNKLDSKILNYSNNLKLLPNNTNNIIKYLEKNKNNDKKKYFFFELLQKND